MNNPEQKNLSYGLWAFNYLSMLARQAGMENDRRIIQSLKLISFKINDHQGVKEVFSRAYQLIAKSPNYVALMQSNNPFIPHPSPGIIDGEIKIGFIYDEIRKIRYSFGLNRDELMQHMLESGRSGAGKTTVLIIILINLMRLKIPFWIFDFKRDYRSLIRYGKDVHVFNWRNFKFNPLLPPKKTPPVQWASIVTEIFFQNFYSSSASSAKSIFLETLIELYEAGANVTMCGFRDAMSRKLSGNNCPGSVKESIKTIILRLRPFISILGDAVSGEAYDLETLLDRQLVLELDGLGIEYQTFLATLIFHWLFTYRLCLAQRGELRHVLLFDEAKRLFSLGNPLVAQLVSTAREFGQGLILADQMPSSLDHAVLANVYTTITLNIASMREIQSMAYTMGLNDEQRESLNSLPIKTAIVKLAGRYPRPFLIHIPELQVDKSISDAEVSTYMQDKFAALTPQKPEPDTTVKSPEETPVSEEAEPMEKSEKIDDNERRLLWDIKNHPFTPATERLSSLKFTNYMGQKLYSVLIEKGLVRELEIKTNYRGRPQKFYELTDKGVELVGAQVLGQGKGGFEHRLHQHRLKDVFEKQGYQVVIEEFSNGKNVDLGLNKDGQNIAVEIIISSQNAIDNIEKDIASGWKIVWLLCNTQTILDSVKKEWQPLTSQYPNITVEFQLLSEKQFF